MESAKTRDLVEQFLQKARDLNANVELLRVLRSRAYQIGTANVLIRAAVQTSPNKAYFFGLNYITAEEVANLDNPFFAFICGEIEQTLILPASIVIQHLPFISRDRNGEYKINIRPNLELVLSGRKNRFDCSGYLNAWQLLLNPPKIIGEKNTVEQSLHTVVQGRLLEIGNIRGYQTFSPNKSKKFNGKPLGSIATLPTPPKLEFSDYELLRQIDVLWFRERSKYLVPEYAFEVEISTGTWSGVGRMATLLDYSNARLYIISNDPKKYQQVVQAYSDFQPRYRHVQTEDLGELYAAELNLRELRAKIDL